MVFDFFCSDSMWWMWLRVESVGCCMFEPPLMKEWKGELVWH